MIQHRDLALRAARESVTLLTNKNNFLPLDKTKIKTIAVIGPHGNTPSTGLGYTGVASKFVVPLRASSRARPRAPRSSTSRVRHCPVVAGALAALVRQLRRHGAPPDPEAGYAEAVAAAKRADVAIVFVGTNNNIEAEGRDRTYLGLPPEQEELVRRVFAANPKTVVVLLNGGPIAVPWEKENLPAVLDMYIAGEEGGNAVADVLFGNYNPAGRLPYTVYESADQVPPMTGTTSPRVSPTCISAASRCTRSAMG